MFDAIQAKVVTNQIKGACNRIDMILSDIDTLTDFAKNNGREVSPKFIEALEDQAMGQVADLQQLILGMTMVFSNDKTDTESDKFEVNTEKPKENDEGEGSAFQAKELEENLVKKEEDDHARREQRM